MKKLMIAVGAVLAGAMAMASTPASFAYQGVLRDDIGQVIGGSSAKITFRLYNDPTAEDPVLWSQIQTVSLDTNGLFNVELSDSANDLAKVIATSESAGKALYIGLTVDGSGGEIRPRQKLIAAPLAAFAQDVSEAKGDFTINGTTYFKGPVSMTDEKQTLTGSNIDATGKLTVTQSASLNGGAAVSGGMKVTGGLTVNDGANISGSMTVEKDITVTKGDIKLAAGQTVTANGYNIGVPIGCILMWSGDESDIPAGWELCDGHKAANGKYTPDLRGRFIVGAGNKYGVGDTGGKDEVKLTKDQMPNHSHPYLADDAAAGVMNGELELDKANYNSGWLAKKPDATYRFDDKNGDGSWGRRYMTGTAGYGASDTTVGTDGESASHENRPPYYALCFIMKVQ